MTAPVNSAQPASSPDAAILAALAAIGEQFWKDGHAEGLIDGAPDQILKLRPANCWADMATKLRGLLFFHGGDHWLQMAALGVLVPDFDRRMSEGDYRDQLVWNAISDAERLASCQGPLRPEWAAAMATYLAARAAEDRYDTEVWTPAYEHQRATGNRKLKAIDDEYERLQAATCAAETTLMDVPSATAGQFAFKSLIAHGGGRDTDCWDGMLEGEARRFAPSFPGEVR